MIINFEQPYMLCFSDFEVKPMLYVTTDNVTTVLENEISEAELRREITRSGIFSLKVYR